MVTPRRFVLGKLGLTYENGFIRYVKAGGAEVVRMIYFALRDRQWRTIPFKITGEQIHYAQDKSLRITYQATNQSDGLDILQWSVKIYANTEEVTFGVNGVVLNPFVRNRVGLCVLHPIDETIGRSATIVHPDQTSSSAVFPVYIKPHQPFQEIQEFRWKLDNEVEGHLVFEGDIFETEDQRNWSDASFKTYSTPLRIPFPIEIQSGDLIDQRVTLKVNGLDKLTAQEPDQDQIYVHVDGLRTTPFPELGTCYNHLQPTPTTAEVELIRQLPLQHLRIDLYLADQSWSANLRTGLETCRAFELSPMIGLHFSENVNEEWRRCQHELGTTDTKSVRSVWIFGDEHNVSNDRVLHAVRGELRSLFPNAAFVGGSASHFVELNRYPFNFSLVDAAGYSVTPQAHANDDRTIIENLAAQPHAVRSARQLSSGKPVIVSPITLRGVHAEPDLRQSTLFTAGWTVGSIKYLGEEGVSSLTFFESHGAKGLINSEGFFPVFDTLRRIGNFEPETIVRSTCSHPLNVSSLVLRRGDKSLTILANHTPDLVHCSLDAAIHVLAGYGIIYIES
jgi:hypothetical protein